MLSRCTEKMRRKSAGFLSRLFSPVWFRDQLLRNTGIFREFSKTKWVVSQQVRLTGGESGIRTHVTLSSKHAFQACAFSHSAISPAFWEEGRMLRWPLGHHCLLGRSHFMVRRSLGAIVRLRRAFCHQPKGHVPYDGRFAERGGLESESPIYESLDVSAAVNGMLEATEEPAAAEAPKAAPLPFMLDGDSEFGLFAGTGGGLMPSTM
jgi:hypothetical protein